MQGWTQAELGTKIGLERSGIAKVESGDRRLDATELYSMADAFGLPLAHFIAVSPLAAVSRRVVIEDAVGEADRTSWWLDSDLAAHARDAAWLAKHGCLPTNRLWEHAAKTPLEGIAAATALRIHLRIEPDEPLPGMADLAERVGLYMLAVSRRGGGASLRVGDYGVAVVGVDADPGLRRATAAHEIGHHLIGDAYNSDIGLLESVSGKEQAVNEFASELLLPSEFVKQTFRSVKPDQYRDALIPICASFRVSWSLAVRKVASVTPGLDQQALTARIPSAADFMLLSVDAPKPDLDPGTTGPGWRAACVRAFQDHAISAARCVELVHGAITVDELHVSRSEPYA